MRVCAVLGQSKRPSFNRALAERYLDGMRAAGAHVEVLDLDALTFDPILHQGYAVIQELEPDLVHAQRVIERADHVLVAFPLWWGTPPALLTGFFERAFLPGWAFSFDGWWPLPKRLLRGRSAHVLVTMDSPRPVYDLWYRRSAHRAVINGTLRFCGFGPVSSTTVSGVKFLPEAVRKLHLARAERLGRRHARR